MSHLKLKNKNQLLHLLLYSIFPWKNPRSSNVMGLSFILHLFCFPLPLLILLDMTLKILFYFREKCLWTTTTRTAKKKRVWLPKSIIIWCRRAVDYVVCSTPRTQHHSIWIFHLNILELRSARCAHTPSIRFWSTLFLPSSITLPSNPSVLYWSFFPPANFSGSSLSVDLLIHRGILLSRNRTVNVGFYSITNRLKQQGHCGTKKRQT